MRVLQMRSCVHHSTEIDPYLPHKHGTGDLIAVNHVWITQKRPVNALQAALNTALGLFA